MTQCKVGDDISVDFSFTLLGTTTLTDPPDVKVLHRKPDLTETTYEYLVDSEITKKGVGQYNFTKRMVNEPRTHIIRPIGEGAVNKSQEAFVEVVESYFLDPLP